MPTDYQRPMSVTLSEPGALNGHTTTPPRHTPSLRERARDAYQERVHRAAQELRVRLVQALWGTIRVQAHEDNIYQWDGLDGYPQLAYTDIEGLRFFVQTSHNDLLACETPAAALRNPADRTQITVGRTMRISSIVDVGALLADIALRAAEDGVA